MQKSPPIQWMRWSRMGKGRAQAESGGAVGEQGGEHGRRVTKAGAEWAGCVPLTQWKGSNGNGQIHFSESILLLEFFQRFLQAPHSSYRASSQKFRELRAILHHLVLGTWPPRAKRMPAPSLCMRSHVLGWRRILHGPRSSEMLSAATQLGVAGQGPLEEPPA